MLREPRAYFLGDVEPGTGWHDGQQHQGEKVFGGVLPQVEVGVDQHDVNRADE